MYLASVPFLILCVAKESEHKDKKEEPAQRHPVERILKLGSQVCLAVSSFIGVGVVAQLLIKEGITSQATLFLDFLFKKEGSGVSWSGCYVSYLSLSCFFETEREEETPRA